MSATWLDSEERDIDLLESEITLRAEFPVIRQLGRARTPAHCPGCNAIVYSRRHRLCGVCSRPLPEDLLFSDVEARRVEALITVERCRHRKWMQQRACN